MSVDELVKRRVRLALQSTVQDFKAYAEEWRKLGADFKAIGYLANAELCFSNWKRYAGAK